MKPNILLIIIFIIISGRLNSQDPDSTSILHKSYSFNIQFGLNQIKEMNLLPLVHKGMLTEFTFESERIKSGLQQFKFSLTYSRLKTSLEEMSKSGNIMLKLGYSYNFLIFKKTNLRYYLGPHTSLNYSFMLFPNWDDSHGYWADYLSFGPTNVLSVSLRNNSEWFTSLDLTLLGLFSRPEEVRPYKMDDSSFIGIMKSLNSNIEPGLLNRIFQVKFRTEYRFPVFVTKREAITFDMEIIHLMRNDIKPIFQIISSVGLKIML